MKTKPVSPVKPAIKQGTLDQFKIKCPPKTTNTTTNDNDSNFPEIPSDKELKIYSWNINGLRATINKGSIDKFIEKGKYF